MELTIGPVTFVMHEDRIHAEGVYYESLGSCEV